MSQIRVIVFDANVFGRNAEPDINLIERWASACTEHDAELWIPEIVALELAHHAIEEDASQRQQIGGFNKRRRRWGSDPVELSPPLTAWKVLDRIRSAGAELVETDGESAVEAIKDQVLQQGAGSRKSGVKTGAADSAWVRAVVEHSDFEDGEGVIVVTGDLSALEGTCDLLGVDPPRTVAHLGELRGLLDETTEATAEDSARFSDYVRSALSEENAADAVATLAQIDRWNRWESPMDRDFYDEWEQQSDGEFDVAEGGFEMIGPVMRDAWTETFTARVRVRLRVEEPYARQDAWGEAPEYCQVNFAVTVEADLTVGTELEGPLEVAGSMDYLEFGYPEDVEVVRLA